MTLVRKWIKQLGRKAICWSPLHSVFEWVLVLSLKADPSLTRNMPRMGGEFSLAIDNQTILSQLDEIPSETSQSERRFLYNFFATVWMGSKNVLEIGPFLGGTTRAIALGMCANPRRHRENRLYTYDRFRNYYAPERLFSFARPLFASGILDHDDVKAMKKSGSFKEMFEKIHRSKTYSSLIVALDNPLPNAVNGFANLKDVFRLDTTIEFDAVFVDGCKSWYATKHFMVEVSKCVQPGAYFIFQDYGMYTCFWITSFLGLMKNKFRLVAFVDSTYTFQLCDYLNPDLINSTFPDTPNEFGKEAFDKVFDELLMQAKYRNDNRALIHYALQHAASLAYIGYRDEAKTMITRLANKVYAKPYLSMIKSALRQPTYSPDGPIYI